MQQQNNMVFGNFDDVNGDDNFAPVPNGRYSLRLTNLEFKNFKNSPGCYYAVTFDIEGPDHVGRKIFENWNLQHQNPKVVEIGLQTIKRYCVAAGVPVSGQITSQLIESLEGSQVDAMVKIEVDKTGQYADQNRIARYISQPQQTQQGAANNGAANNYGFTPQPQRTQPNIGTQGALNTPTGGHYVGSGHPQDQGWVPDSQPQQQPAQMQQNQQMQQGAAVPPWQR